MEPAPEFRHVGLGALCKRKEQTGSSFRFRVAFAEQPLELSEEARSRVRKTVRVRLEVAGRDGGVIETAGEAQRIGVKQQIPSGNEGFAEWTLHPLRIERGKGETVATLDCVVF